MTAVSYSTTAQPWTQRERSPKNRSDLALPKRPWTRESRPLSQSSSELYRGVSAPSKKQMGRTSIRLNQVNAGGVDNADDRNSYLSGQILSYRFLDTGWDGPNSFRPKPEAIDAALSFIDLLSLNISPNGTMVETSGEVGFYWKDKTTYIDITFDGRDIIYFGKTVYEHDRLVAKGREHFNGNYLPRDLLAVLAVASAD